MWDSGRWSDQRYSACCFGGARAKLQRLRHNIAEIAQWPRADCNHFHDPQEWEPWVQDGQRHYPSAEESESTRQSSALLLRQRHLGGQCVWAMPSYVPRSPSPSCTGHRDHWLDLDPRALREWAMTPLAISLGLRPVDTAEAARVPTRVGVEEVLQQGALPPGHVYVGMGNHAHRLPTTLMEIPLADRGQLHTPGLDTILCPIRQGDALA